MDDFDCLFNFYRCFGNSIIKEKFDLLYSELCKNTLFLSEYKNFINTGIIGMCDEFDFCLYRDYHSTNKLCVVLSDKKSNNNECSVVFLDSLDVDKYLENCIYCAKLSVSNSRSFFYSSSGALKEAHRDFTFKLFRTGIKMCVSFYENENYNCLMSIKDNTGVSEVRYSWASYDLFLRNAKYNNISLSDNMKCFNPSFSVICNASSSCYDINEFKSLQNKATMLGFGDDFSLFRDILKRGINIHGFVYEIVNEYIKFKNMPDEQDSVRYGEDICKRSLITHNIYTLGNSVSNS